VSAELAAIAFFAGAMVSLAVSWVLVSRIERIGSRLGASEALLGLFAALAADTPEISSAVSALAHHQQAIGAGVVVGSNVFNLAALLGLGAVVAGRIAFHRRVIALTGGIAIWVAAVCIATMVGVVPPAVGLVLVLIVLIPYVVIAALGATQLGRQARTNPQFRWLSTAIAEEEMELDVAIHPQRGRPVDVVVAGVALVVVVLASVAMERAASTLGIHFGVPDIVIGAVVLAAVTSLPNAVAAVYLARRGRGAATLSTALNSNSLNVAIGFLLPAVVLGIGRASQHEIFVAAWYVGLTVLAVIFAYWDRGLRRDAGYLIITAYALFIVILVVTASQTNISTAFLVGPAVLILAIASLMRLQPNRDLESQAHAALEWSTDDQRAKPSPPPRITRRGSSRAAPQASLIPSWSVDRVWLLALLLLVTIAVCDTLLGSRVVLIGLFIVGPCCGLLTGRWLRTAEVGALAVVLAIVAAWPDGIWATISQAEWTTAVGTVALAATLVAAVIEKVKPPGSRA
jgi:cation:H+ antiporter